MLGIAILDFGGGCSFLTSLLCVPNKKSKIHDTQPRPSEQSYRMTHLEWKQCSASSSLIWKKCFIKWRNKWSVIKRSWSLIHKTPSFFSVLPQLLEKRLMLKLGHFGFGLGIDIGLNSLKHISGKQSFLFLFFFQLTEVLNTSVKHTQKHNRREVKQIS